MKKGVNERRMPLNHLIPLNTFIKHTHSLTYLQTHTTTLTLTSLGETVRPHAPGQLGRWRELGGSKSSTTYDSGEAQEKGGIQEGWLTVGVHLFETTAKGSTRRPKQDLPCAHTVSYVALKQTTHVPKMIKKQKNWSDQAVFFKRAGHVNVLCVCVLLLLFHSNRIPFHLFRF